MVLNQFLHHKYEHFPPQIHHPTINLSFVICHLWLYKEQLVAETYVTSLLYFMHWLLNLFSKFGLDDDVYRLSSHQLKKLFHHTIKCIHIYHTHRGYKYIEKYLEQMINRLIVRGYIQRNPKLSKKEKGKLEKRERKKARLLM